MSIKRLAVCVLVISCLASPSAMAAEPQNQDLPAPGQPPQTQTEQRVPQSDSGRPGAQQLQIKELAPPHPQGGTVSPSFQAKLLKQPSFEDPFFQPDLNREIYYRNKIELGIEAGILPINTPLLVGPLFGYSPHRPPKGWAAFYTLVPAIASLRWQLYNPMGPWLLRGNTEFTFGGTYTAITEGPESVFAGPMMGVRYNFIQPNWRLVPYADLRFGLGYTDAQEPYEVSHHLRECGQGQDFTFTFLMSAGVRYNFSPRYSASLGFMAMHISNMYLSEPQYYNHGVNVVGPMIGFNVGLNHLFRKTHAATLN